MKKIISVLLILVLVITAFSACTGTSEKSDRLIIVCTIFPEYDWVMNILGDNAQNVDVTLLLDNGVDLHSYQPTADDMVKVSTCDVFIYVGGESDEWVADALKNSTNKNMVVINLLETLGTTVREEEAVEGMQTEEETSQGEEEPEYDEHVWLSLKNAGTLCNTISEKLSIVDEQNAALYQSNATSYIEKLNALDGEYKNTVDNAKYKALVFGDRFPFRYLVDDYGLSYYAAFVGCSAETEASFETVAFLAKKVDELGISTIITIEGTNHKIAETVIQNTVGKNQKVLSLDSMQATTSKDVENGTTYISVMQKNLEVLKTALN